MKDPQYRRNVIKSLSISRDEQKFLDENPDLSPSKMLQSKIREIRENRKMQTQEVVRKDRMIQFLSNKLEEAGEKNNVLEQEVDRLKGISRTEEGNRSDLARS